MIDLISRQAAIDALDQIFDRCEEIEAHLQEGGPDRTGYKMYPDYMTVWKYLHQLPSVQPEPCEDAVSREAVSKWLKQYGQDVLHGKYKFSLMYIWKNLMDLPPVTPKRKAGKWIYYSPNGFKCSRCGSYLEIECGDVKMNFCPNCSADMRGETE